MNVTNPTKNVQVVKFLHCLWIATGNIDKLLALAVVKKENHQDSHKHVADTHS